MRPLLLLACLLHAATASAGAAPTAEAPPAPPDWFEVELIVFRHTGPDQSATETWPDEPGRPAVDGALELEPTAPDPVPFMALPLERSRLAAQWEALRKSPRFEPIAYFAWVQPPFERGQAPAVRIASAAPAVATAEAPVDAAGAAFPPLDANTPPPLRVPLDGTAALALQRYLYLTVDLVLLPSDLPADLAARRQPLAADATDPAAATPRPFGGFRLTETRRMRSKELHYFDHPMFGAVALVTPRPAPGLAPAP